MNQIDELEDLLDAILKGVQEALQSGEVLSEEFQNQIAQEITLLTQEIDQLYSQQPTIQEQPPNEQGITGQTPTTSETPTTPETGEGALPTGGEVPKLNKAPHESSNINSFKYLPDTKQLYIKFMGKDSADSGPTYAYSGVEKNVFDIIARGGVGPKTSGKNKYHEWFKNILPSHGASVNALLVKGNYPYQRLS